MRTHITTHRARVGWWVEAHRSSRPAYGTVYTTLVARHWRLTERGADRLAATMRRMAEKGLLP